MATIEKTKSKTYNFLSENKSIEDIKNQSNTTFKEKNRHGGKTFKIIEKIKINVNDQQLNDDPSENEIFYDALDDLTVYYANEISQSQSKIQELEKEIQQIKNEKKNKQNKVMLIYKNIHIMP